MNVLQSAISWDSVAWTDTSPSNTWQLFVVSLRDANDRRAAIQEQLNALTLPFEFVEAVDGRNGLAPAYEAMIDRPGTAAWLGRPMADVEYACALSHMSVYRRIVERDLPGAIVLEDDAVLGPNFSKFLDARAYCAAPLIQLDHDHGDIRRFGRRIRIDGGLRFAEAARNTNSTAAYSISRTAAEHLLQHGLPLRGTADWPCDVTAFPAYLAVPKVARQPDMASHKSDIEAARAAILKTLPRQFPTVKYLSTRYWKRWWFKRMTRRVS